MQKQKRRPPTRGKKTEGKPSQADAQHQLDSLLAKYSPEVAAFGRRAVNKMRKLVPGAIEMVYDNYNWLVDWLQSQRAAVGGDLLHRASAEWCHSCVFCRERGCPIRSDYCGGAATWCEISGCSPVGSKMRKCSTTRKCSA